MPEHPKPKKSKTSSVINKAAAKKFLLQFAEDNKHHKFTRVSEQTLNDFEANAAAWLRRHVASAPSKGQTL